MSSEKPVGEALGEVWVHVEVTYTGRLLDPQTNVAMLNYQGTQKNMVRDMKWMRWSGWEGVELHQTMGSRGTGERGEAWGVRGGTASGPRRGKGKREETEGSQRCPSEAL